MLMSRCCAAEREASDADDTRAAAATEIVRALAQEPTMQESDDGVPVF